jgi:hypothetical protein
VKCCAAGAVAQEWKLESFGAEFLHAFRAPHRLAENAFAAHRSNTAFPRERPYNAQAL